MSRRQFAVLATGAAFLVCTACGSSASTGTPQAPASSATTTPALTGDQVTSAVKKAAQSASAVHVKGSMKDGDTNVAIDMQLNKDSASGTVTEQGATIPLRLLNGVYYMQFTDDALKMAHQSPTSPSGRLLRNKWVPSTSKMGAGMVSDFKDMLSLDGFLQNIFGEIDNGTLTPTGPDTVDGLAVLGFKDTDGSIADVGAAEPHYLIRVVGPTSAPGTIDFTGWNQPVQVTAPAKSEIYSGPGA